MKKMWIAAAALAASLLVVPSGLVANAEQREALPTVVSDHAPRLDYAKGFQPKSAGVAVSNLAYNGGPVMATSVTVTPIYWGTKWSKTGNTFTGDKVSGLGDFYSQYGGSDYAKISSQYTQQSGAATTYNVSAATAIYDLTKASSRQSSVANEVVVALKAAGKTISANGYYPVYTDLPRGHAGYCAWHSYATYNGVTFKYAFFFSLDGDAGCDPGDSRDTYSQGTEALANVSAHELAEAMTDPQLNAWYDSSGAENADKCGWQFNSSPFVVLQSSANYGWKIQGEWSNSAGGCRWN